MSKTSLTEDADYGDLDKKQQLLRELERDADSGDLEKKKQLLEMLVAELPYHPPSKIINLRKQIREMEEELDNAPLAPLVKKASGLAEKVQELKAQLNKQANEQEMKEMELRAAQFDFESYAKLCEDKLLILRFGSELDPENFQILCQRDLEVKQTELASKNFFFKAFLKSLSFEIEKTEELLEQAKEAKALADSEVEDMLFQQCKKDPQTKAKDEDEEDDESQPEDNSLLESVGAPSQHLLGGEKEWTQEELDAEVDRRIKLMKAAPVVIDSEDVH